MSCFFENDKEKGTLTATMIFRREELLYDIKNNAYIEGDALPDDASDHIRHLIQDIGEEGNIDRVSRVLDRCHAQAKEALYPFTKHAVHSEEVNNRLREPAVYGIVLSLPSDFSQTTLRFLEKTIHEYMVSRVMEDWLSIVNTPRMEIWRLKAETLWEELKGSLIKRTHILRRKQSLF